MTDAPKDDGVTTAEEALREAMGAALAYGNVAVNYGAGGRPLADYRDSGMRLVIAINRLTRLTFEEGVQHGIGTHRDFKQRPRPSWLPAATEDGDGG